MNPPHPLLPSQMRLREYWFGLRLTVNGAKLRGSRIGAKAHFDVNGVVLTFVLEERLGFNIARQGHYVIECWTKEHGGTRVLELDEFPANQGDVYEVKPRTFGQRA